MEWNDGFWLAWNCARLKYTLNHRIGEFKFLPAVSKEKT